MYRCLIHSLIYVHPELNAIDLYLLSPCSIRLDMGLEKDDPCCQGGWRKWYCGKNTIEVNSRETLRKFIASLLQHTRLKGLKNTQSKNHDFIITKIVFTWIYDCISRHFNDFSVYLKMQTKHVVCTGYVKHKMHYLIEAQVTASLQ